jgi:hypothetical protein
MVYEAVKTGLGEPLSVPEIKWGMKMIRYWDELFIDADGNKFDL